MYGLIKETEKGYSTQSADDILFTNRRLFIDREISSEYVDEIITALMVLSISGDEEITLFINTPGGEVLSGLALYDYILGMNVPVRTVCVGGAYSMGAIIFLAGDKREMLPHTRIMIHDPAYSSNNIGGKKPHEILKQVDKLMESRESLAKIIAERTDRDIEEIYKLTMEDSYFNVDEAIEFGIATGVYKVA
ncbi:MAG: ATP-dependent Clp protease proteolytic subunit [Lachnospiraceae bacterium]|nr:ATP-dependent Clp protease proteolytic subunit [Lachnospiraceae bacterium]